MPISSRSLFHFTKSRKILIQILDQGFWPKYCGEYKWGNRNFDFALPMVCFCDIPLSLIEEHCKFYGFYGIGLNERWKNKQKYLNPVFYLSNQSSYYPNINLIINNLIHNSISSTERNLLYRIKKVNGMTFDCAGSLRKKKFYDEREWRYIPEFLDNIPRLIKKQSQIGDEETKKFLNDMSIETKAYPLKIFPNDIEYLIIPHENERLNFIVELKEILDDSYPESDILQLMSRILVLDQLNKDF